ncbi:MAG: Ig-like domain-containing protein [Acidiferrobacterales bacterium]
MSHPSHWKTLNRLTIALVLIFLSACRFDVATTSGGGGTSYPPIISWPDVSPQVVSISPANLETGASVGGNIVVQFNTKLDPASVNNSTFDLQGVSGDISVADNIVLFRPTSPDILSPNTQYFVSIKGGDSGIKSFTGKIMANDFNSQFTTGKRTVHYLSPTGNDSLNDGKSLSSPWKTFKHAFSNMGPGDELILDDGTYSEAQGTGYISYLGNNSAQAPSGDSPANSTYIHALNPGKVFIDGRLFVGRSTRKDSYIKFEGITFIGGGSFYNTYYVTVKNSGFDGSFSIGTNDHDYGNTYDLVEDVWIWASQARIIASNYRADFNTWRRVVVRGDGCNLSSCLGSGNPNVGITVYESNNTSLQNIIVVDRILNGGTPYSDFAVAQHTPNQYLFGRNEWLGTISVNAPDSGYYMEPDQNGTIDPTIKISNAVAYNSHGAGFNIARSGTNNQLEHLTSGNAGGDGIRVAPELTTGTLSNSVVFNAGKWGINSKYTPTYTDVWNSSSSDYNQTTCSTGCLSSNPLSDGTPTSIKYITRIENGSLLESAGSGGGPIGANVIYRYGIDGSRYGDPGYDSLTSTPLWPWPNEGRIKAEMCASTTRGFCTNGVRLDGVNPVTLTTYIWEQLGNAIPAGIYP